MFPYLIKIGALSIQAYPLLYGIGIVAAGTVAMRLSKREGIDARQVAHLILILTVLILLGGRFFYVLVSVSTFRGRWIEALDLSQAGQVHYGGLIFAALGGVFAAKILRLPLGQVADNIAVGAPLGVAVGRLGCFCCGCCFGRITTWPWAVTFPPHVDLHGNLVGSSAFLYQVKIGQLSASAARSLPVHPSQLYEACAALVVFGVMLWLKQYSQRFAKRLLVVYVLLYCFVRFLIEFTRTNPIAFFGLTIYQVITVAILIVTLLLCLCRSNVVQIASDRLKRK